MHPRSTSGFTLVELSIVLVIIGLLTGGVLTGQALIRASELRSVTSQEQRYVTAVQTFRDKYFGIPGDITNATKYWGVLAGAGNDATCQNTVATGPATCDGDGDSTLNNSIVTTGSVESYRFWQHLANAGLIEGSYTGVTSGGTVAPGTNAPVGKFRNSYFFAQPGFGATGTTTTFTTSSGNMFVFRNLGIQATPGSLPLKPEEAYNIDAKMDDGAPGTGKVMGNKGTGTAASNCTTAAGVAPPGDAGATYNLTDSSTDCFLQFQNAF